MSARIGVDLGGTKIEVIALDPMGRVLLRERLDTPSGRYEETLEVIGHLVNRARMVTRDHGSGAANLQGLATIGLGIPGSLSPTTGKVRGANSTALNGRELKSDIQALLQQEVRIENDANCLAMSESVDGAGAGSNSVFAVILGTGVGGGLVINGKIVSGFNRIGGEWGHNRLAIADQTIACWCGRTNCNEAWLSGPGFAADYLRRSKRSATTKAIVELARSGDDLAKQCLQSYCERLGFALAQVINVFDPQCIVLGGGMSNIEEIYQWVPQMWRAHVFSDECSTTLVKSQFGDSSGVRGAAWLWN